MLTYIVFHQGKTRIIDSTQDIQSDTLKIHKEFKLEDYLLLSWSNFNWSPNFCQTNEHFVRRMDRPNDEQIILYIYLNHLTKFFHNLI